MSRKLYVGMFILVAAMFVPVILNFGVVSYVVPSACIALIVGGTLFYGKFVPSALAFGHLVAYLLLFYLAARGTFWLSMRSEARAIRLSVQVLVLLAVLSCSFLREITYSSIQGQGGTYTFWGAANRFFEKRNSR